MKAVWIDRFGGPDVLNISERSVSRRAAKDVLVKMRASTLNHHDIYLRRGEAGRVNLPVILGSDGAGTVVEADPNSLFKRGDDVVVYPVLSCGICSNCSKGDTHKCCRGFGMIGGERDGTQAEFALLPEQCLVNMPADLDFEAAASISLAGLTAWNMIFDEGSIHKDENVLVLGATGGVGVFVLRILKLTGAHVYAATSSTAKRDSLVAMGADFVIDDNAQTILNYSRKLPEGGFDAVFNWVGGNTWRYATAATRMGGRIFVCGSVRAPSAELDMRQVFYKNISIIGCSMGRKESLCQMLQLAARSKDLRVPIERVIGLCQARDAHVHMESAKAVGKTVFAISSN